MKCPPPPLCTHSSHHSGGLKRWVHPLFLLLLLLLPPFPPSLLACWQVTPSRASLHKDKQQLLCHQVEVLDGGRKQGRVRQMERQRGEHWVLQSACINDEITLADASDLRSAAQICGWLAVVPLHIHAFPFSCEVCPWHSVTPFSSRFFYTLSSLLSRPPFSPLSALVFYSYMILAQAFRPKIHCQPLSTPPFFCVHIKIFVPTLSGKLLFRAGRTTACSSWQSLNVITESGALRRWRCSRGLSLC